MDSKKIILLFIALLFFTESFAVAQSEGDRFSEYEIRVIRPRYFQKSGRFELFGAGSIIANNTFVYTLLATGGAQYHIGETLAVEAAGSYGFSIDRNEKTALTDKFNIQTEVIRVQYELDLSLYYTPIYGKVQVNNRQLVYFDTFLTGGFGLTGIDWQYSDFCPTKENRDIPADQTISYPTFLFGLGQRFFTSKNRAYRWDFKGRYVQYNKTDSLCDQSADIGGDTKTLLSIQIGTSKYF